MLYVPIKLVLAKMGEDVLVDLYVRGFALALMGFALSTVLVSVFHLNSPFVVYTRRLSNCAGNFAKMRVVAIFLAFVAVAAQGGPQLALNTCTKAASSLQMWQLNATGGNNWGSTLSLTVLQQGNRMCMDIQDFSIEAGAVVYTWPCGDGSKSNEAWNVGSRFIQSLDGGNMCLAAAFVGVGGAITTAPCNASDPAQLLSFNETTGLIVNLASGLCVDAGTPIAWCTIADHASWTICDVTAPIDARAADIVSRLSLADKIAALGTSTPALPSVGLSAYNWWSEATHGISRVSYSE